MANSSNETYIGINSGQMKDETFSGDNIITKTIKIDNSKNMDVATKFKNANVMGSWIYFFIYSRWTNWYCFS